MAEQLGKETRRGPRASEVSPLPPPIQEGRPLRASEIHPVRTDTADEESTLGSPQVAQKTAKILTYEETFEAKVRRHRLSKLDAYIAKDELEIEELELRRRRLGIV